MKTEQELITKIGTLIKNSPDLHNLEYEVGINLHTTTFFQKTVSKKVLDKGIRVKPVDYLKALVFLDYFTSVIEDDCRICDNIIEISKVLRKEPKDTDVKEDMSEDPSYLSLDTIVADAGLCAKEKGDDYYSIEPNIKNVRERYESLKETVDFKSGSIRKADLYYEAIGQMICDLVEEKTKPQLKEANSRIEVGAIVFTDSIMNILKDTNYRSKVNKMLEDKEYFEASLTALDGLSKEISIENMQDYILKS